MTPPNDARYGIQELVQATGVPRRTLRFYVQRGLVPPPKGAGRGHYYTRSHLERVLQVRELQEQGRSLREIEGLLLDGEQLGTDHATPTPVPVPELVTRIRLAEGLELLVSHGARAPSADRLLRFAAAATRILNERGDDDDD